jgi:cell division protease FtsH
LLRPGRFEFHLNIPYPDDDDRREILKIYDRKMRLQMSAESMNYAVRRTGEGYSTPTGTQFSGDHINALCRAVARIRLRENRKDETAPNDVERGLTEYEERRELTDRESMIVATHESGHFLCNIVCRNIPDPERITIRSEMPWALGYVMTGKDKTLRFGRTRKQLVDLLCMCLGGIEAERYFLKDISTGAGDGPRSDLDNATNIAHAMVEYYGMGDVTGLRQFRDARSGERQILSGAQAEAIDRQVNNLINEAQKKAAGVIRKYEADLVRLREELFDRKSLDHDRVVEWIADFRERHKAEIEEAESAGKDAPAAKPEV